MLPPGRPKEERKNSLWLKNLPQQYNTIEALAGFFKKYGQIRDIFTTPEASTACVMFYKEQDTLNAYNNSEKVFGKPFIFKTLNADEEPPAQLMTEIKNMELKRKKSEHEEKTKMQLKEMRQQLHSKLSDRYRAILFVYNRLKGSRVFIQITRPKSKLIWNIAEVSRLESTPLLTTSYRTSTMKSWPVKISIGRSRSKTLAHWLRTVRPYRICSRYLRLKAEIRSMPDKPERPDQRRANPIPLTASSAQAPQRSRSEIGSALQQRQVGWLYAAHYPTSTLTLFDMYRFEKSNVSSFIV